MRCCLAVVFALGLLVAPTPARAGDFGKKESAARAAAAEQLLTFAAWCADSDAKSVGTEALATAREFDPDAELLDLATTELAGAGDTADAAIVAKGRKVFGPSIAKAYAKLAGLRHAEEERARFDGYRLSALAWEPSPGRVKKTLAWIKKEKDADRAGFLLSRARAAAGGAAKPLDAYTVTLAKKGALLLGSPDHALVGWVWLPKSWKKGRSYPVLVGVDGAGSNHKGYGAKSASARGSRDVIVLSPATLSNTNALQPKKYPFYEKAVLEEWGTQRLAFDGPGVDGLLAEIRRLFGGEEKVFLTGFSGGGQYAYYKLLHNPAHVRGAVPCCANFAGGGKQGAPGAGENGGPPVLLLTGENDKHREFTHGDRNSPGIEPQTDHAQKTLAELGYRHVERRMVKSGHSPLHAEVWKFVDSVLGK